MESEIEQLKNEIEQLKKSADALKEIIAQIDLN